MKYFEALKTAEKLLKEAGIREADVDARQLLEYASGLDYTRLLLKGQEEIPDQAAVKFREVLEKRRQRIPLQQIVGKTDFMGISLEVSEAVLTPRQDTEILAEEAIGCIRKAREAGKKGHAGSQADDEKIRVLDLCTGSGCLIIAAKRFCPEIEAVGTDISGDALDIAQRNVQNSGAGVTLVRGDLFENIDGMFDVIMSNPPYIRSGEISFLMEEVRDHEPRLALDGGRDGLSFYRKIAEEAPRYMKEEGWLLFEIGFDQGEDVKEILKASGFSEVSVIPDLSGSDRVVKGKKG